MNYKLSGIERKARASFRKAPASASGRGFFVPNSGELLIDSLRWGERTACRMFENSTLHRRADLARRSEDSGSIDPLVFIRAGESTLILDRYPAIKPFPCDQPVPRQNRAIGSRRRRRIGSPHCGGRCRRDEIPHCTPVARVAAGCHPIHLWTVDWILPQFFRRCSFASLDGQMRQRLATPTAALPAPKQIYSLSLDDPQQQGLGGPE